MRFFKRLAGFLGFVKDDGVNEGRDQHHQDSEGLDQHQQQQTRFRETGLPRKGFSVPVQVAVDRPHVGPVLIPCNSGDGGVQDKGSETFGFSVASGGVFNDVAMVMTSIKQAFHSQGMQNREKVRSNLKFINSIPS